MSWLSRDSKQVVLKNPYKRINQAQLPLGWLSIHTQALPLQWRLKNPHMFHPPFLALFQSQKDQVLRGSWFMYSMQYPSSNLAHLELEPKQPLQRLSPIEQLEMSEPRMGRVVVKTPPTQGSQYPPSVIANGVNSIATVQKGREATLQLLIQSRGSALVQGWSPSKGLQLLQENLPAQLFSYVGNTVGWNVIPLFTGCTLVESDAVTAAVF